MSLFFDVILDFLKKIIDPQNDIITDVRFYIEDDDNNMASGSLCVNTQFSETLVFDALSGPYGLGALPEGRYTIQKPYKLSDNGQVDAYMGEFYAWVAPLTPEFKTERDGLLIHPDGNMKGTKGCIGIVKDDHDCYIALCDLFLDLNSKITLEVIRKIKN